MRLLWAWSIVAILAAVGGCQVQRAADDAPVAVPDTPPMDTGLDAPRPPCTSAADCDDSIACTSDNCAFGGVCEHTAIDALCASGETCDLARGCITPTGDCTVSADCMVGRGYCDGTWVCIAEACYLSEPRTCDDGNDCTSDTCDPTAGAGGGCVYSAATGCDGGVATVDGGGPVCNPFDPATGYSGSFRISPGQLLDCSVLYSYRLSTATFSVSGGTLTVTGGPDFPATLTGPAPTGSTFTVNGSSGCATFAMTGTFSCDGLFNGTFTRSLSGECAICGGGSSSILGRR